MILSGWILPDLYEVTCTSCSTSAGHIQVVKRFLKNLEERDFETFTKIQNRISKLNPKTTFIPLDDFAVMHLGWVKIIDLPCRLMFVAENSPLEFLSTRYEKLGYHIMLIDSIERIITPNISGKDIFNP